jgi:hypothetical protein
MNFCKDLVFTGFTFLLIVLVLCLIVDGIKNLIRWIQRTGKLKSFIHIVKEIGVGLLFVLISIVIAFVGYWIFYGIGWLICQLTALL